MGENQETEDVYHCVHCIKDLTEAEMTDKKCKYCSSPVTLMGTRPKKSS